MKKMIKIKVIPNSSKNEFAELMSDGTQKIRLKASPVDGQANTELIKFLSKKWKIPQKNLLIKTGKTSKNKLIKILE